MADTALQLEAILYLSITCLSQHVAEQYRGSAALQADEITSTEEVRCVRPAASRYLLLPAYIYHYQPVYQNFQGGIAPNIMTGCIGGYLPRDPAHTLTRPRECAVQYTAGFSPSLQSIVLEVTLQYDGEVIKG